ncbi:MAG: ETC complex I subunit [Alphaproteobacteria bacterium]
MHVRIYRPAKTSMQSGRAKTRRWVVEFEPRSPKRTDPLMGWIGSADVTGQMRLFFPSRDDAVAYATRQGFDYQVDEPHDRTVTPRNYADNFRPDRLL